MYCPSVLMMPFGPAPYLKMLTVPELRVRPPRLEEFGNQSWCAPGGGAVPKMNPMMVPTAAGGRGQLCAGREEHKKEGARRVKGHVLPPIRAPILTVPKSAVVARVMCRFLPASAASVKVEGGPQGAYTCRSWTARRRGGSEEEALREREGWAVPRVGLRRGVVKGRAGVQYFVVTSLRLGRS